MTKRDKETVKRIVAEEVPTLVKHNEELRQVIVELNREHFADKAETESRFEQLLEELRKAREEDRRKWEENQRRWQELQQERKQAWEEWTRRWDEKVEEDRRKWEEAVAENRRIWESIIALHRRYDQGIGALGARWGLQTEASFRNALKGILEESFGVEVLNVTEFDQEGEVFGRPDQVEVDLIIKNGMFIIAEIRSSMSCADMYTFDRKVRFFEKKLKRPATRKIVISPMVDERARKVADEPGIEVYITPRMLERRFSRDLDSVLNRKIRRCFT